VHARPSPAADIRWFPDLEEFPTEGWDVSFARKGTGGTKIMYFAAVCVPCPEFPDGKVLLHACHDISTAKRNSCNRAKGERTTKDKKVDGKYHAHILEEHLFPKLKAAWKTGNITVQTDNAKPQVGEHAVAAFGRWPRINMLRQPARSPDVNILDEGLFHHLQVAVDKQRPGRNSGTYQARQELESAVEEAWKAMPREQITRTAHHLNDVFRAIEHFQGGNMYRRASKFAIADY